MLLWTKQIVSAVRELKFRREDASAAAPVTESFQCFAWVPKLFPVFASLLNSSSSFPIHGHFPQNVIWKSTHLKSTLKNPTSSLDSFMVAPFLTHLLLKTTLLIPSSLMHFCPLPKPIQLVIKSQKLFLYNVSSETLPLQCLINLIF